MAKPRVHRWGPWEQEFTSAEVVTFRSYFARRCLDCGEPETAEERYLCDIR